MTIAEQIDSLRLSLPGCSLVAFGDVTTQLVLRSSQSQAIHREHLDQLCDEAGGCFSLIDTANIALSAYEDMQEAPKEAVVVTRSQAKVFVKSGRNDADFLCLICSLPFEPTSAVAAARSTLDKIADAQ
jgi:hypothetical protein